MNRVYTLWNMQVSDELIREEIDVMERTSGMELDQLAMAVSANLWRASQIFRKSLEGDVLREYGLTWGSFSTLFIVWVWEPIEMSRIAEAQYVTRPTISSTINHLEKRGLCVRKPSNNGDGRSIQVHLTDDGRNLIEDVFPRFNQGESRFVAGLDVDELQTLARLLRKLLKHHEL